MTNRHPRRATPLAINHANLTTPAYDSLRRFLIDAGNTLSRDHEAALATLCGLFTKIAQGKRQGRRAFGLPTGMGKTSTVVHWCATLAKLGDTGVSVAVSASKVEALCDLKRDMINAGVPEDSIGLLYSPDKRQAFPVTDDNDQRPIMLVAHNRIRMADGHAAFMTFKGKPRNLLIWDESLIASEAACFDLDALDKAVGLVKGAWRRVPGGKVAGERLDACLVAIDEAIKDASETKASILELPELTDRELDDTRAMVPDDDAAKPVADLLSVYREDLRVFPKGQGSGVVWYRMAVPKEITNVVVLDASYVIRELCHADKSIKDAQTMPEIEAIGRPLADLKRHDNVIVHQLFAGGGRSTMFDDFKKWSEQRAVKEVVDVVKGIPEDEAVLIFVFKQRSTNDANYTGTVYKALTKAGIDTHAKLGNGKDRINVATYGQETSLNRWAHCQNVILCGLLQRSRLDLAGSYIGQCDNIKQPLQEDTIGDLARSEAAHVAYQALSRGCCRVMDNGQAKPMKAWFIHRDYAIRSLLNVAMPGIRWETWESNHLTTSDGKQPGVIASTAVKIAEYLKRLPEETRKVSVKVMKRDMEVETLRTSTFADALKLALAGIPAWLMDGRSVVRDTEKATAYGF
ncbi:MAG: hypothetical protein AB7V46_17210 [Thermomicrobiales bacterium]